MMHKNWTISMAKKDWMIIESELDEDQIRVLMATNDKSIIVSGCAGSGKSVLALIKAQRIQREKGDNYKIIVYTKALCNYMNAGREVLGLHNDFYYHWDWKNRKNCASSDYFIVDEIQDFTQAEINDFINACNKNFFFFGDTAQSIYDGLKNTMPVEDINYMFGNKAKVFNLYKNYRLPKSIAQIVQYVGIDLDGFDINTYKSKETSIPRIVKYNNLDEQIKEISNMISNGRVSDVGILLRHNNDVKLIHDLLNEHGINHEVKYEDKDNFSNSINNLDFTTENPKVMTYHSAKGLQFGTIFLPDIKPLSDDPKRAKSERKALYVAMTRTYRNLYIMYNGVLPFPLSEIPNNLYKTTINDTVEDI